MDFISNNWLDYISNSDREKAELAQYFIKCYVGARQGLTKLGILRTERNLQGDYAVWLSAKILGLEIVSIHLQKLYDAKDTQGKTYKIKSRLVKNLNQNTSFDLQNIDRSFDYLLCVFLSPSFDLLGMIRVTYEVVRELGSQTKTTFRFRWNKQTSKDPRIEWIFPNTKTLESK
ncbi:hypothetical protein GWK41_08560 [Persephonella atlantica]|uniref:Uncharacterized protein n=1 Tax=Persephonella atlantica TaxID=2699429 RepID=A0ABS1GJV7_9AQUI|nr:hypothetical protein [Persephonella atlantica]MBK3333120.1 hypothetical protein [Persephonella atlantica]